MKRCFKCLCEKPLDAFYKHSAMADGHLNKCKECTKSDVSKHRSENLERIREYDKSRSTLPHRVELRNRVFSEWLANHPDRRAAHSAVGSAVRSGRLMRWPVCELPECNGKAEAHHPDYSQPLMVTWLCRPHHMQAHAISNKE